VAASLVKRERWLADRRSYVCAHRRSSRYGTRVFLTGPLSSAELVLNARCFRVLEAVHQAFVGHVAWFYVVE
jgi:hypothetical protein